MTAEAKKRGLGRGLDALFGDMQREAASLQQKQSNAVPDSGSDHSVADTAAPAQKTTSNTPRTLPVDKLTPGKFQPRRRFQNEAIDQLAESISVHGVLQPLFVRPLSGSMYEIIAGERRWRAAQKAQVHDLPVVIRDLTDEEAMEIALIENLQREDLSPLEEAEGYARLIEEFGHTQEKLAHQLGKSRSHVANMMRLLKLPSSVKNMVDDGVLTMGHARAILGAQNPAAVAAIVAKRGLSVRQTEKMVNNEGTEKKVSRLGKKVVQKDPDILALEDKVSNQLGLKVSLEGQGSSGKLVIEYKTLDQLDDVLARLATTPAG